MFYLGKSWFKKRLVFGLQDRFDPLDARKDKETVKGRRLLSLTFSFCRVRFGTMDVVPLSTQSKLVEFKT